MALGVEQYWRSGDRQDPFYADMAVRKKEVQEMDPQEPTPPIHVEVQVHRLIREGVAMLLRAVPDGLPIGRDSILAGIEQGIGIFDQMIEERDNALSVVGTSVDALRNVTATITAVAEEVSTTNRQMQEASRAASVWRWVSAVIAGISGTLVLYIASHLTHGFVQILLEAAGAALLTFLLVNVMLDRLVAKPTVEMQKVREHLDEVHKRLDDDVPILRDIMKKADEMARIRDKLVSVQPDSAQTQAAT